MKDLKQKAVRGVAWSALENWSGQGISFVVFLVLARILGPQDFGLVALAAVYVTVVQTLIRQGFAEAIVQVEQLEDEHLDTAFWTNVALSAVLTVGTLCFCEPVAALLGNVALGPVVRWMSLLFVLGAFSAVPQAILNREMQFKALALRTFASFGASGVTGISMALAGWGVWSLVGQQVVYALVNVISLWTATAWRPRVRFSPAHFRQLWRFGANIFGMSLLDILNKRTDQFVVGRFLGATMLGYYSVAARVQQLMLSLGVTSLNRVAAGAFSRLQREPAQLAAAFYKSVEYSSSVAFPAFLGFAALAPEIIHIFFGAQWLPAVGAMQWLLILGALYSMQFFHGQVLRAMGRPSWQLGMLCVHTCLNVALYLLLVRRGLEVMVAGTVIRAYLLHPAEVFLTGRLIPLRTGEYAARLWPQIVTSVAMACGILLLKNAMPPQMPAALVLAASVVAGAIFYILSMALLRPGLLREFYKMAQMFAPRTATVLGK